MNINKKKEKVERQQEGQALLFVIVALTVALSVGVSTSLRTLSTVSRTSTTDTSARVLSAAEGGIEKFLAYSSLQLDNYKSICTTLDENPDSRCIVNFEVSENDNISTRAVVKVEDYILPQDGTYYNSIDAGRTFSLDLGDYTGQISLCWSGQTDIFEVIANGTNVDDWVKNIYCGDAICYSSDVQGTSSSGACGISGINDTHYATGVTLDIPAGTSKILTLVPLQEDIDFVLSPVDGSLGNLGFLITSQGELDLPQENAETVKKVVTARRSRPFIPKGFYFGIFGNLGISAPSN